MSPLEERAKRFAIKAHGDQTRKYTFEPYWYHCEDVANIVRQTDHTEEQLAIAWMHDVLEDTQTTYQEIADEFGTEIAQGVLWLTDVSKPEDGNRKIRKAKDAEHLSLAPYPIQTIKLADLISNMKSIDKYDPDFAVVYKKEKEQLLAVMKVGDPILREQANQHARPSTQGQ